MHVGQLSRPSGHHDGCRECALHSCNPAILAFQGSIITLSEFAPPEQRLAPQPQSLMLVSVAMNSCRV